ncbi:long-chain fatty acid--CoA ligase [Muribaculum sp. An289]|uniref:AMP-binding protein n=1 Tax=Candidatus Merdivivens faecigallinarum TaxID=2840871 RepID=A0A9D9NQ15_9BACT|nr:MULTISPECIES: AMP-binding protein [unclassified Muribaculum]MBO8481576.1 AMP-binding protein [Candidatus Merdivivens faecigallinarum]OUO37680.1 long-chain fatty acid--CoA ligase [Muribaculum sp. An289]OUO41581.1 long-chain fatty acid--CoA ligase [Muribaculum sp. An287]
MEKSLNKMLEESFRANWDRPALSDYKGVTLHYRDVAKHIAKLHIIYDKCGIRKGDKIAICAKNQANWGVAFLSCLTYGAVAVPILHEFKPSNVHYLVNHSDARILFVDEAIWGGMSESEMPALESIIRLNDFTLIYSSSPSMEEVHEHVNELFGMKYPKRFTSDDLCYHEDSPEEMAMINYTSGTSGFSKGVMIPYRALVSNALFAADAESHMDNQSKVVSMLPTAHMYGMMFEFLFEMTIGTHVYFLTRVPGPRVILEAFEAVKPDVVIAVPLIIEKIYRNKLQPIINRNSIRLMMSLPVLNDMIKKRIHDELVAAFGGVFREVIIGGAAFNREVEHFFKKINFPFTVGYGMTECAPIISYAPWNENKLYSCGRTAPNMEIRIDSPSPSTVAGEVQVRGKNVFLGYYKNEEATKAAFTDDGWFKTGDMGVMDSDGFLFLRGRSKSMILGPSGQNIYPEEIESSINNMPYVVDSLVIDDGGTLTALIYPDFDLAEKDGMSLEILERTLNDQIKLVNMEQPNYCQIKRIEVLPEDFERTPKRSIKRYLYQRNPQ